MILHAPIENVSTLDRVISASSDSTQWLTCELSSFIIHHIFDHILVDCSPDHNEQPDIRDLAVLVLKCRGYSVSLILVYLLDAACKIASFNY